MPSSLPAEYLPIGLGDPAPEDGFFLTIPGMRKQLTVNHTRELDYQEKLAERTKERDNATKQLSHDAWLARWGLPLGGAIGLVVGGVLGAFAAHH